MGGAVSISCTLPAVPNGKKKEKTKRYYIPGMIHRRGKGRKMGKKSFEASPREKRSRSHDSFA